VPGVADQISKTKKKQDQKARQADMQELLRMVQEGRLHEADERQLESLKLALEINTLLGERSAAPAVDSAQLAEAVKQAIAEGMANVTVKAVGGAADPALDPSRPQMKHVSLVDLVQDDTKVDISHSEGISKDVAGEKDSTDKLEQLRKLKGGK
jgi:hypothetical protein